MGRPRDHGREGQYVRAVRDNPGASQSEIANVLAVSFNAARSALRRLRRRGVIDHKFGRGWYFKTEDANAP